MGDGVNESVSDTSKAFDLVERSHESGIINVTATSLRMINFNTFENEIISNNLSIIEKGITSSSVSSSTVRLVQNRLRAENILDLILDIWLSFQLLICFSVNFF